jgi:predicted transcriptional regulator
MLAMTSPKTETLKLKIEPELLERLQAAADQDRRTRSNLVRYVLADWLERRSSEHGARAA